MNHPAYDKSFAVMPALDPMVLMCAIRGVYFFDPDQAVEKNDIFAMREIVIDRGFDGLGRLTLYHMRLGDGCLNIVDVADGHGPQANQHDTELAILKCGSFRHEDVGQPRRLAEHQLRTGSDPESMVHQYEELGKASCGCLMGMLDHALYKLRRDRLLLPRGRFGIRSLYYRWHPEGWTFGCEIKAILANPDVPRQLNRRRVPGFFHCGHVHGPNILFKGIRELVPGRLLAIPGRQVGTWMHLDVSVDPGLRGNQRGHIARFKKLLWLGRQSLTITDVSTLQAAPVRTGGRR